MGPLFGGFTAADDRFIAVLLCCGCLLVWVPALVIGAFCFLYRRRARRVPGRQE